jgi:hypothetical protein
MGFGALAAMGTGRASVQITRAAGLAGLAPLGFVLEALIGIKRLLAGCEDEFPRTIGAFQYSIVIFHMLLRGLAGIRTGAL